MTLRRRLAHGALAAACLISVQHAVMSAETARNRLTAAEIDDERSTAEEARAARRLVNTRSELRHLGHLRSLREDESAAADQAASSHGGAIAQERNAIEGAHAEFRAATRTLEELGRLLGIQEAAIEPLRACVAGVGQAAAALANGDHDGAAGRLGAASDACLQARAGGASLRFPYDFPDPHVVRGGDRWIAYATNSSAGAVQMISSPDLRSWRVEGNALAAVPSWAQPGATWAPAVIDHGGSWLLFYTVRERASGLQCISVASASSAAGPFVDRTSEPLVCERDEGGSIDPEPVRDGNQLALLWKTELDTRGGAAEIRAARLGPGGTALAGDASTLLRAGGGWEGRTIEGPTMLRSGNALHLLFSGNSWSGSQYGVGTARCDSVLGPCRRTSGSPILAGDGSVEGPGGLSVFQGPGGPMGAYHGWQPGQVGYPHNRYLHFAHISAEGDSVRVRPA